MFQAIRAVKPAFGSIKKIPLSFRYGFFFFWLCCVQIQAQVNNIASLTVSLSVKDIPLINVLKIIEQQVPYKFAFNTELIAGQKNITVEVNDKPLDEIMLLVLKGTAISYNIIDNQIVLLEIQKPPQITVSGYITDSLTGEYLPSAIIYFRDKKINTYSNNYGFYSLTLNKAEKLDILISYIGYKKTYKKIGCQRDTVLNFYLTEDKIQLNTIVISRNNPDDNIKKNQPGRFDVPMEMIRNMPSVNGSGDLIHTIQMMPGVMAGLDGRPGYFIRGGNTDQNLIQLDEATLYNPDHLLGLVGIFNSSAIKSAFLLKAGFPASFGDHLSSVLDVTMKDGNMQQFEGDLQAGSITSSFTLSGPLVANKSSFFVSARRSTIDLWLKPLKVSDYYSNYNFYDINAKFNVRISQKDRLFISFYQGRDNSAYSLDSTQKYAIHYDVHYGNQALALRWNHLFSQKIFSNTSVIYNNYFHDVTARQLPYYAELYSGIRDVDLKTDFYYYPALNLKISAGINYLHQTLFPATIMDRSNAADSAISIIPDEIPKKYADRIAIYFGDDLWLNPKFNLYLGARIPLFITRNVHYLQFEPRVSLMRILSSSASIKLSYTRMHQFLNLVQSYNASFPAEIWIGSGEIVKPQNCQEASVGLFNNFKDNMFQTSLEFYYKHMGNQLMFREGLNPSINSNLDNSLVFGQGSCYGAELYVGKSTGKLTGWLAYTLSYSKQQFDSLNLGKQFPFANDRRHSLYLSVGYAINKHWQISSNFIFASGSAFSLFKDAAGYHDNALYYNNVSGKDPGDESPVNKIQNNYRLAAYNRLDLGISYKRSRRLFKRTIETQWVFSIYNVYAHANTFFAYCSVDPVSRQPIPVQVYFVPVIPGISYSLKF
jgi:hypothetical protein